MTILRGLTATQVIVFDNGKETVLNIPVVTDEELHSEAALSMLRCIKLERTLDEKRAYERVAAKLRLPDLPTLHRADPQPKSLHAPIKSRTIFKRHRDGRFACAYMNGGVNA